MKRMLGLLVLSLLGPAAADLPPESVVEALYRADLSHYGNPSRWGRPHYTVVPYQGSYFASTSHGGRQASYTYGIWEYLHGRWSYIFEVEHGPGDAVDFFFPKFRPTFAQNGFSAPMMQRLLKTPGRSFPGDQRGYSLERKHFYGLLRAAVRNRHPKADDPEAVFNLLPFEDGKVALLQYYNVKGGIGPELWRYSSGSWRHWMTVPEPWEAGAEARWIAAGVPAGLRSKLIRSPQLELPYYP